MHGLTTYTYNTTRLRNRYDRLQMIFTHSCFYTGDVDVNVRTLMGGGGGGGFQGPQILDGHDG